MSVPVTPGTSALRVCALVPPQPAQSVPHGLLLSALEPPGSYLCKFKLHHHSSIFSCSFLVGNWVTVALGDKCVMPSLPGVLSDALIRILLKHTPFYILVVGDEAANSLDSGLQSRLPFVYCSLMVKTCAMPVVILLRH